MTHAADQERREHRHLTADELSAAAESVRRGGMQSDVDQAGCEVCCERVEDLLTVLDTLPRLEPPALPQMVAIRIDAALVREAQQRAADALSPIPLRRRRSAANRRLGWATAGLALVCAALSLAALSGAFNSDSDGSSSSATAQSTYGPNANPASGVATPVASALLQSAAASSLSAWAISVLTDPSADAAATGKKGPMAASSGIASVEAAVCAADPAYKGMTLIAEQQGTYDDTSAELVVYGSPGQTSGADYAVAFALPCTAGDYQVLSQGYFSH